MILKLVKTELRADGTLILAASIVSALLWLSETALRSTDTSATFSTLIYGQLPFPVLLSVLGVRMVNQKRERLFAQLPVSGFAVRVSGWLCYLVVIAIACLITTAVLALYPIQVKTTPVTMLDRAYPDMGWILVASVGALMIAMLTAVAAVARISQLTGSIRAPLRIVIALGGLLVCILLYSQWKQFAAGEGPFRLDGIVRWDLLGAAALGATFVMIVADVLLDRLADNHLR